MEKLLTKKQLKELIGFSFAHIDRMETDPKYRHLGFPKRVKIGFRAFWAYSEVQAWIASQIATRDALTM